MSASFSPHAHCSCRASLLGPACPLDPLCLSLPLCGPLSIRSVSVSSSVAPDLPLSLTHTLSPKCKALSQGRIGGRLESPSHCVPWVGNAARGLGFPKAVTGEETRACSLLEAESEWGSLGMRLPAESLPLLWKLVVSSASWSQWNCGSFHVVGNEETSFARPQTSWRLRLCRALWSPGDSLRAVPVQPLHD